VVTVIEVPAEVITLDLDSEELHYLCQETNRPTLGVNWDYLGWVYRSSYVTKLRNWIRIEITFGLQNNN